MSLEQSGDNRSLPGRNPKPRELPAEAVEILKKWLFSPEHFHNPYPTHEETAELSQRTGLKRIQIKNWFVNARRRCWKRAKASQQANAVAISNGGAMMNAGKHAYGTEAMGLNGKSLSMMDVNNAYQSMAEANQGANSMGYPNVLQAPNAKGFHNGHTGYPSTSTGMGSMNGAMNGLGGVDASGMLFAAHGGSHMAYSGSNGAQNGVYPNGAMQPLAPRYDQMGGNMHQVPFQMPMGSQLLPMNNYPSGKNGLIKPEAKNTALNLSTGSSTAGVKRHRKSTQPSWARYTPIEDRVLLDWAKAHHWKSPKGVKLWKDLSQKWSTVAPNLPQRPWQSLRDRYLRLVHERKKKGPKSGESATKKQRIHGATAAAAAEAVVGPPPMAPAWAANAPSVPPTDFSPHATFAPESAEGALRQYVALNGSGIPEGVGPAPSHGTTVLQQAVACSVCHKLDNADPVDGQLKPCGHIVHVRCFFNCNQDFVTRSSQISAGLRDAVPVPTPKCPVCAREVLDCDSVFAPMALPSPAPPAAGILRALDILAKLDPALDAKCHPFLTAVPPGFQEVTSSDPQNPDSQEAKDLERFRRASVDLWRVRLVKRLSVQTLMEEESRIYRSGEGIPAASLEHFGSIKEGFDARFAQIHASASAVGDTPPPVRDGSAASGTIKDEKTETLLQNRGQNGNSHDSMSSSGTDTSYGSPAASLDFFGDPSRHDLATADQMERATEVYLSLVQLYADTVEEVRKIQ